mgnify:CR=1 FL=1
MVGTSHEEVRKIKEYALEKKVPIMQDEGIDKMDEALNPGALLGTADSMNFGPLAEIVPTVLENLEKRS